VQRAIPVFQMLLLELKFLNKDMRDFLKAGRKIQRVMVGHQMVLFSAEFVSIYSES
jgi:hypothetical protein